MAVDAAARPGTVGAPPEVILEGRQPGQLARLRELWTRRSLVWWFARKFTERLYANTWLGLAWIPLRPIFAIVPRALIFGGVLKAPSNGVPYLLFFAVGLSAWQLLDMTWYFGTRSLEISRRYLKRAYLPRLALLTASVGPGVVLALTYAAFASLVVAYYVIFEGDFPLSLGTNTLLLPAGVGLILALALSLGLWTSVLGAQARDVRWTVRMILTTWFLLTPVIYPLSAVPDGFKTAAELNPMTAPMELVREGVFGVGEVTTTSLAVTLGAIAVVGALGMRFFDRSEAESLDYL